MELIAHVSVRRHLIESVRDRASGALSELAGASPRRVAVFRVLGQSPGRALKILGASTEIPATDSTIALALGAAPLTAGQVRVCQTVIDQCRRQTVEFLICGNDLTQLRQRVVPELSISRWFPSAAEMVQQLGKEDARQFA